ncbi:hypothetical protein N7466_007723 [Penicillium verhagenii]|uniref:uncharacterized protein n=1 Tax=Penicillium verhagenii TaxID=1562060 RepID=UPI002544D6D9|nr:uncharacterized protein N7466_007723 [Penicillium verhagenii]KAJ5928767.1 hypothetical protein N7466_007723 [Penicillium verhagenii]
MADVRSLLRNELASRKGTSPNTTGNRVTKKRKVDNSDGVMRKKLRSTSLESVTQSEMVADPSPRSVDETVTSEVLEPVEEDGIAGPDLPLEETEEDAASALQPSDKVTIASVSAQEVTGAVDEDEWAAFEREVAEPSRMPEESAAVAAAATISAAPVSADEIAAQQERDTATTSRARDAELEGVREDAARFMEEEFDEMDQLEERVRRLKHMREELREKRARDEAQDRPMVSEDPHAGESESDDDDEDEDWDDWRFK